MAYKIYEPRKSRGYIQKALLELKPDEIYYFPPKTTKGNLRALAKRYGVDIEVQDIKNGTVVRLTPTKQGNSNA